MIIELYRSAGPVNAVDKTDGLERIARLDGSLRSSVSLVSPSVIFRLDENQLKNDIMSGKVTADGIRVTDDTGIDVIYTFISAVLTCSYVHIPDFDRWYFVDDITSVADRLWQVDMKVDVLMTYRSAIRAMTGHVVRKASPATYIYDPDCRGNGKVTVRVRAPETTTGVTIFTFSPASVDGGYHYTMTYTKDRWHATHGADVTSHTTPPPSVLSSVLPSINNIREGDSAYRVTVAMTYDDLLEQMGEITEKDTAQAATVSLCAFPFELPKYELGKNSDGTSYYAAEVRYLHVADFTLTPYSEAGNYTDYLHQYDMYVPYYGWLSLDPMKCLGARICLDYVPDYSNATAVFYVTKIKGGSTEILFTGNVNLGQIIPYSASNASDINRQTATMATGVAVTTITGLLSAGTGNPAGAVASAVGMAGSVANGVIHMKPQTFGVGISNRSGSRGPNVVMIRDSWQGVIMPSINYRGSACDEWGTLGDYSGITYVDDVRAEGLDTATKPECDEVVSLLANGVIL